MTEKEICNLYESGLSLAATAKRSGASLHRVRRILDQNNTQIRSAGKQKIPAEDPRGMVHLGVKITKAQRDALAACPGGKSVAVREAIGNHLNKALLVPGVDYPGFSVAFLIVHPKDEPKWNEMTALDQRFLFSQRGPGCRNEAGKWEFGGGELHLGETIYEAVVREVKEEYGLEVTSISESTLVEQFIEGQHWLCSCVFAFVKNAEIKISEPDKVLNPTWASGHEAFETWDMSQASINAWEAMQ
jgi:8-oxo-dGTP pyrophosphatase MutT (NUDIX family)